MKEDLYQFLEDKFLTYKELSKAEIIDNGEPLMALGSQYGLRATCIDQRMTLYTADLIYVRQALIGKLKKAQEMLHEIDSQYILDIVYGYRHPNIQKESFEAIKKKLCAVKIYKDEELLKEDIHHYIAVPEVAGHPTGGAVDVRIIAKDTELDMGTKVHDFIKDSYVYAPTVTKRAWHNRQILRICMTAAGFAPYDGEWWHFSYGDREWAHYYKKPHAIYDQVILSTISEK